MERDEVFSVAEPRGSDFEFDPQVAAVFDDMVVRSVPFYEEQQRMIRQLRSARRGPRGEVRRSDAALTRGQCPTLI